MSPAHILLYSASAAQHDLNTISVACSDESQISPEIRPPEEYIDPSAYRPPASPARPARLEPTTHRFAAAMSLLIPDCTFGAFHHCVGLCCPTMCSTLCCAMCFRTIFTPLHSSATTLVHLGKLCQPCFCISQIPQHGLVIVCWQTFRELSAFGMQLQTDRCACLSSLSRMYLAGHELQSDFVIIVIIIVVVIMIIIIIIVILLSLILSLSLSSSILLLLLSLLCAPQRHFPEALQPTVFCSC